MSEKRWTDDERSEAFERGLKTMEGVALELYRRGREPLLEELEEARARNADMRAMLEQVTRERDEARAEVGRLRAEAAPMNEHFTAGYRDGYRDAYRRGAEAMREACAQWFREHDESFELTVDACHDVIADMPIPEEP